MYFCEISLQFKITVFYFNPFWNVICVLQSWIFSIITPVFSVTRSFRNHSKILIWCFRNILSKVTWHTAKYGDPYSEFVLCIWPILSAHTQQWTHTHCEHTPGAVGSHLCSGTRGAVGGSVPCSRAPQSWYWRRRERCTFTPPTYNPCRPETRTRVRLSNH